MRLPIRTVRFSSSPEGLPGVERTGDGKETDAWTVEIESMEQLIALRDAAGEDLIICRDSHYLKPGSDERVYGDPYIRIYDGYME